MSSKKFFKVRPQLQLSSLGDDGARALLVLGLVGLVLTAGALNGQALAASSFDTFKTWAQTMLASSYVQAIGLIVMVIGVWQAKTGKGWSVLEGLLVILVIAFIVPSMFTSAATATRSAEEVARADQIALVSQQAHQLTSEQLPTLQLAGAVR
jgi:hypothetical protein